MAGIYLNQVGYLPDAAKTATLHEKGTFTVLSKSDDSVIYSGETLDFGTDEASGDAVYIADFSSVKEIGKYYLQDSKGNKSYSFEIKPDVYKNLHHDLIKALYYQRCGCALEEKYAGIYKHAVCHGDLSIDFNDKNIVKDMTGGWHDAGDYGRYITPACVTVAHILYSYILFPDRFNYSLDIPESGNGMPDALNECRYELEWMLKMQKDNGGVYHKLTAFSHAPFIMPEEDKDQFYMFQVSSMATADFAACMCLSYRVYKNFDEEFANRMLEAAKKAYAWLILNPDYKGFRNPEGSNTGEYDDDKKDRDERLWAAAEMLATLGGSEYEETIWDLLQNDMSKTDFGWIDVSGFASMAILLDKKGVASVKLTKYFSQVVVEEANRLVELSKSCGYGVAMNSEDYIWGSNMVVSNRGILLILANIVKPNPSYVETALNQLHYLLGKNATGYSYVTGHGENAFCHPHNRPNEAAKLPAIPGQVSGGPNKNPCDEAALKILPKECKPMKCYADHYMSYSTNEITIYWNSSVVFLATAFI